MPKKTKQCQCCGKGVYSDNVSGYCANCLKEIQYQENVETWLLEGKLNIGVSSTPRGYVRVYILEEQNHKCNICGIEEIWNEKELIFILDHIDGDASNNKRTNLRMICPNCDSQLETYKSKNKNSARTYDRDYRREHTK